MPCKVAVFKQNLQLFLKSGIIYIDTLIWAGLSVCRRPLFLLAIWSSLSDVNLVKSRNYYLHRVTISARAVAEREFVREKSSTSSRGVYFVSISPKYTFLTNRLHKGNEISDTDF